MTTWAEAEPLIRRVYLFGSRARGDNRSDSDIDLAILNCTGLIKLLWHDGVGLCMLTKRLEQGQFAWPSTTSTGRIALTAPQLAALLDGCEWRHRTPIGDRSQSSPNNFSARFQHF